VRTLKNALSAIKICVPTMLHVNQRTRIDLNTNANAKKVFTVISVTGKSATSVLPSPVKMEIALKTKTARINLFVFVKVVIQVDYVM